MQLSKTAFFPVAGRKQCASLYLDQNVIYQSVSVCNQQWTAPLQWPAGDLPVVYRSFESDIYLELKGGASITFGNVRFVQQTVTLV